MATDPTPPAPPAPAPARLPGLPFTEQQLLYGLFVLAGLFAAIPLGLLIYAKGNFRAAFGPTFVWGLALAVTALVAALTQATYAPSGGVTPTDKSRVLLLVLGGCVGLVTTLLGAVLPFTTFSEQLKGGLESWRANPRALVLPSLALFGGLGLMFVSLQLGRGMERTNQTMRRVIYGYNAVLTGLLLLAVLALPNVLSYAAPFSRVMGRTDDWSQARVYTLQPDTQAYLEHLEAPVRVLVLLEDHNPRTGEMRILLNNFRAVTPKVSWEIISSDFSDRAGPRIDPRLGEVQRRYNLPDPYGVVVVLGDDPKTEKFEFIPANDLFSGTGEGNYFFTGERALLNAIKYLSEGKAVVYFTQGSGEPAINPPLPTKFGAPPPRGPSMVELGRRLSQRKGIEVKELKAGPAVRRVPDDATLVVIARPTQEMPKELVQALEDYVNRRGDKAGKLLLLLDPIEESKGGRDTIIKTGLEAFLARQNVKLGNDTVYNSSASDRRYLSLTVAETDPRSANPIARAFNNPESPFVASVFPFFRARTVTPAPNAPPGGPTAEKLLRTRGTGYWAEEDPNVNVAKKALEIRELRQSIEPKDQEKYRQLAGERLCLGVTVTAPTAGVPGDAAHARLQKPRMVVLGNALWATDHFERVTGLDVSRNFDLFENSIAWLRERPTVGKSSEGPGPRKRYTLGLSPESQARVTWLPLGLMALGVVGLGCGVWVVRRR
jgi:hypothetical protein